MTTEEKKVFVSCFYNCVHCSNYPKQQSKRNGELDCKDINEKTLEKCDEVYKVVKEGIKTGKE